MSSKVVNTTGPPKPDEGTAKTERRSPRIFISIPIRISGNDAAGQTFREDAKTLVVNRHGAKIATTRQLALGRELTVENPLLGRTSNAKVVWLGEQRSPSGAFEATLEVAELQNLLGVDFPPDSWQDGPPMGVGGQRLDKATSPGPIKTTARLTTPAIPPKPAAVATPEALDSAQDQQRSGEDASPSPEPATPPAEGRVPFGAGTEREATGLAGRAQPAAVPPPKPPQRPPAEPSEARPEPKSGLKQPGTQLRDYRDEMQALASKFQELKQINDLELRNAQSTIGEVAAQTVKAATREIREKVHEELERGYSALLEKGREQLRAEASTVLADLRREASTRLAGLTEEFFAKLRPEAQALGKQITKSVELLFKSEAVAYQEKLTGLSTSGLQGIQSQVDVMSQYLTARGDETIQTVKSQLRAAGKELIEGSTNEIQAAMQAGLDSISSEVETSSEECRKHLHEALQEFREQAAAELQTHFQQVAENLELASQQLREKQQQAVNQAEELFRDRLAGILRGIMQVVVQPAAAKPGRPKPETEPSDEPE